MPILALILLSCNNGKKSEKGIKVREDLGQSSDSLPSKELVIVKDDEEGWGTDIRLSIVKAEKTDTLITYFVSSHYDGRIIGFKMSIPSSPPKNGSDLAQILTFTSIGVASDYFISTLSKLYKQKVDQDIHFISSKGVAFIDLDALAKSQFGNVPVNKTSAKEMKIFFEAENPDDNAELYININEKEHWVEIKEKDEGYRKQVIKGFTTK